MKRTTGACLLLGLLAAAGLLALFLLPRNDTVPLDAGTAGTTPAERPDRAGAEPPALRRDGPGGNAPTEAAPAPAPDEPEGPARLVGRVVDSAGLPVAGARAYAAGRTDTVLLPEMIAALDVTDEEGAFALTLVPGPVTLVVFGAGRRPLVLANQVAAAGEERDLGALTLPDGVSISGRIVTEDGSPVPGATAIAYRDDSLAAAVLLPGPVSAEDWGGRAESDDRGEFRITGLASRSYRLRAEGVGIRMATAPVEAPPAATNVKLVVRRYRVATGLVVSEADDSPVVSADVTLTLRSARYSGSVVLTTDSEGRFVADLSDERLAGEDLRFDVKISAADFEEFSRVDLPGADLAPEGALVLKLVPAPPREPGRLSGRILYDTGEPFSGAWITLSFSRSGGAARVFRVQTAEDGGFFVDDVPSGEYSLRTAPRSGRTLLETGRTLVIPPGGEERTRITVPRGADLTVTVVDPRGDPVPGAQVEVLGEDGTSRGAWMAVTGTMVLPDLPPGPLTLKVTAPGYRSAIAATAGVKGVSTPIRVVLDPR